MSRQTTHTSLDPEVIALKALQFLAKDEARLERFMSLTGLTPQAIRKAAGEPAFLGGVLEQVLQDESLLLEFAEAEEISPTAIQVAHRALAGAPDDF